MSQYDLIPLRPDQFRKIRNGAIIALAALALFCAAVLFGGCAEKEMPLTPKEQIVGAWKRTWLDFTQTYSFDGNGQCLEYSIIPGQPVQSYLSAYTIEGGTLTMTYLAHPEEVRCAEVEISEDGNTATLAWLDGVNYTLIRIQ